MAVIEIKPRRWGWKVLEAPGHEADSFVIQIQALVDAHANGLEGIRELSVVLSSTFCIAAGQDEGHENTTCFPTHSHWLSGRAAKCVRYVSVFRSSCTCRDLDKLAWHSLDD